MNCKVCQGLHDDRRCCGLPGLPCYGIISGRDEWCMNHMDREYREARWAMDGYTKRDVEPLIGATRNTQRVRAERLPLPNEDQLRLELGGFYEEDDRSKPQKPDVTRPPENRKGNTRRGAARHTDWRADFAKRDERVPIPKDLHGRLWHMLTLEEKLTARQTMTDAEIAAWAKGMGS